MRTKRWIGFSNEQFNGWQYPHEYHNQETHSSSRNYFEETTHQEIPDDLDFGDTMKTIGGVIVGIVLVVLLIWLIRKCCCQRSRGQIITLPPPAPDVNVAVYPQQQYAPAHNVATYPVSPPHPSFGVPVLPQHGAPYPTAGAPYPNTGAPYPNAGAPYPNVGAPYPPAGAPYPTDGAPYPTSGGAPPHAPNAPDTHAMPPSYEQAVSTEKSTPYNPHYPH